MKTMILQTNAGNQLRGNKAKVTNYGEVWFDIEGMANILVSPKWKINIASSTILQWNQPST